MAISKINTRALANDSVTTDKVADNAITTDMVASGEIGVTDLADGSITNAKVSTTAAIAASKVDLSSIAGNVDLASGALQIGGTTVINSSRQAFFTAATGSSLKLERSDVGHGMTAIAETATFGHLTAEGGANGGLRITALADTASTSAFNVSAYAHTPSTDGNAAVIRLRGSKKNGTGEQAIADSEDLLSIGNVGTERIIVKGNGDFQVNGTTVINSSQVGFLNEKTRIGTGATYPTDNAQLYIQRANNNPYIGFFSSDGSRNAYLQSVAGGNMIFGNQESGGWEFNNGTSGVAVISNSGALTATGAAISGAVELGSTDSTVGDLRVYDTGNNSLRLFGVGSNSFEFDLLGTGSTGTVNFSQYNVGIGASDTQGFKMRIDGAIKLGTSGVTHGSTMLTGNYADGQEGWNIGSEYSTAAIQLMYGVKPSTTAANTYISSVDNANWKRSVLKTGEILSFQTAGAQNTSVGTAVALTERFSVLADGRTTITSTASPALQVNSNTDSARAIIANTSGTATFSYLELSTSSYGTGYLIKNVANSGNGLNNGSLYLWNSDSGGTGAIEFVPNQTIANRTTVEENGDLKVRGSRLTVQADTVSWSTAPHILFETTQTNTDSRHWRVGPADSNYGNFHIFPGNAQGDFPDNTTESNSGITIKNNGNVGFGCLPEAAPKLEINAGSDGAVAISARSDGGNGNNRRFNILPISDGGTYGGGIKIQTRNTSNAFNDHLTIRHNGQINHTGDTPIVSSGSVLRTGRHPQGPETENSTQKTPKQLGFANMYVNNWATAGGRYIHMKTNIPSGTQGGSYGMLLIKAHGYRYSPSATINSSWGFHNWNGTVYSLNLQNHGNLAFAVNAYAASDGYIVLVGDNGSASNAAYVGWSMDFIYANTNYPAHTVTQSGASHAVTSHANTASTTGAF